MKKFEAKTLEEAYELAAIDFECSVTEITFEVIQQPSNGFFGFGKKNAVVMALRQQQIYKHQSKHHKAKDNRFKKHIEIREITNLEEPQNEQQEIVEVKKQEPQYDFSNDPHLKNKDHIFDNFYSHHEKAELPKIKIKKENDVVLEEVNEKLRDLFGNFCYKLNPIKVSFIDDETLYIEFSGEDAALLIGKEGYRYKALSYILFNWINEKYGLMIRLEVAEFLSNQEEAIYSYLNPLIEQIHEAGSGKTKVLDGVLIHIALKKLRESFPEKYVAAKTNKKGEKYILVNEYRQQ